MHRLFILLFLYSMNAYTSAQGYHSEFDQNNFELFNGDIQEYTNGILIATNKPIELDNTSQIFSNAVASDHQLRFLIAINTGKKWKIKKVNNLTTGMQSMNERKDVVLFVHGNGKTLSTALSRAKRIQEKYNVSVILFDWPSNNNTISKSLKMAEECESNFFSLLTQLKDYRNENMNKEQHLSIIAHSLGNYFFALLVNTGKIRSLNEQFIDNLILNAPAIKAKKHAEIISCLKFQKNTYIVINKNDLVLRGAQMITARRLLGNLVLKEPAKNANYVHFTNVAGKEHTYFAGFHEFEYTNPAIQNFYNTAMHGLDVDLNNEIHYKKRNTGDGFKLKSTDEIEAKNK